MVIERLARDAAADACLAVLPPESDGIAGIAAERLVGKDQIAPVRHAEHPKDCQDRRKLNVLLIVLETRDRRRADLGQRGELLLRELHSSPAADCFFDKNWPIELKLPFHRRSIRSSRFFPSASSPTRLVASVTAFSAALRLASSFLTLSVRTAGAAALAAGSAARCLGRRDSSVRLDALPIASASWRYSG